MNAIRTLCLSALVVPALCASLATGDKLEFRPAEGSSLSRVWTSKQDLSLEDMQIAVNGQPQQMPFQMEMDMSIETEYGVTDKFVAVGGGAPKELLRTFDKLGANTSFAVKMPGMPNGDQEHSVGAKSELEGKTVKFKWNEEEHKHDLSFHESEGDAALLTGLDEDMDLRAVLPGKEVAAGDTWDIDVKSLRALLMPGGDVKLRPTESGDEASSSMMPGMDNMSGMSDMLGEMLEGEAKAEYKGQREVEGAQYGVIQLTVKIASNNDMTEKVSQAMKEVPPGLESMSFDHMDVQLSYESEGELLWDVAGGFIHSLDMSGKMKMDIDMTMKLGVQGRDMSMDYQMTLSGTVANKVAVTKN